MRSPFSLPPVPPSLLGNASKNHTKLTAISYNILLHSRASPGSLSSKPYPRTQVAVYHLKSSTNLNCKCTATTRTQVANVSPSISHKTLNWFGFKKASADGYGGAGGKGQWPSQLRTALSPAGMLWSVHTLECKATEHLRVQLP